MKNLIAKILGFLTRAVLMQFKPVIVGVTGSVGKTSTKEAIVAVVQERFSVRSSVGNYNNEFGLPLAVLGEASPGKNIFGWLSVFFRALLTLLKNNYPQVLVLEMGADKPGDITYLLRLTGPLDYAVITDIGISHLLNYSSKEALAKEKLTLARGVKDHGTIVLNIDNEILAKFASEKKNENIVTYGSGESVQVGAVETKLIQQGKQWGLNFKIKYQGATVPVVIPNALGRANVYAGLAAACVGLKMGMNLVEVSQGLGKYSPPAGRLRFMEGIKHTWIIDDTYNAAPASVNLALDVLKEVAGSSRKVAVLGGMAELGNQTESGHKEVAIKIQEVGVEMVFLVGDNAKIIRDELERRQFKGIVKWFDAADNARIPVQNEIREGDMILIKGSQSSRMEKVVKEIMADPQSADKVLVRQSEYWQKN